MATSTASGYGTYAPAAIDPFPIESVLAKIVGDNNPAEAANMLDTYQVQNQTSQGNYNYAMQGQHDFAKQQLAQQLYEANLKGLAELKDPTVLQIASAAPQYQQLFGGAGQGAIGDALQRAQAGAAAKNFGEAGKGAEGFSNAGYMIPGNAIPGMPSGVDVTQTENARIAAERIRANAMLGAASIRAAGGGGSGGMPTSFQGIDPDTQLPVTGHAGPKTPPAAVTAWKQRYGGPTVDQPPPNPALPGVGPNTSGQPMAKTDTPANAPPPPPSQNTARGADAARQMVNNNIGKLPAAVAADIRARAGTNGGQPVVQQDAQGNWHAVGVKGVY